MYSSPKDLEEFSYTQYLKNMAHKGEFDYEVISVKPEKDLEESLIARDVVAKITFKETGEEMEIKLAEVRNRYMKTTVLGKDKPDLIKWSYTHEKYLDMKEEEQRVDKIVDEFVSNNDTIAELEIMKKFINSKKETFENEPSRKIRGREKADTLRDTLMDMLDDGEFTYKTYIENEQGEHLRDEKEPEKYKFGVIRRHIAEITFSDGKKKYVELERLNNKDSIKFNGSYEYAHSEVYYEESRENPDPTIYEEIDRMDKEAKESFDLNITINELEALKRLASNNEDVVKVEDLELYSQLKLELHERRKETIKSLAVKTAKNIAFGVVAIGAFTKKAIKMLNIFKHVDNLLEKAAKEAYNRDVKRFRKEYGIW